MANMYEYGHPVQDKNEPQKSSDPESIASALKELTGHIQTTGNLIDRLFASLESVTRAPAPATEPASDLKESAKPNRSPLNDCIRRATSDIRIHNKALKSLLTRIDLK